MKSYGNLRFLLGLASLIFCINGCQPRVANQASSSEVKNAAEAASVHEKIRSIFYQRSGIGWQTTHDKSVFFAYPSALLQSLYAVPTSSNAESYLAAVDSRTRGVRALDLLNDSLASPPVSDMALGSGGVNPIVVIVPGIFGEFIANYPFDEVFSRPSQFADEWSARASGNHRAFDFNTQDFADFPLKELVKAASVDLPNGQVAGRLLFLKPPFMSLETLGTLDENVSIYFERLNKVFSHVDWQNSPIYFMGYSRGAVVALHMAAQLSSSRFEPGAWKHNVKGVISLAGTLWGSQLADEAGNKDTGTGAQFAALKRLADGLQPMEGNWWNRIQDIRRNSTKIVKELWRIRSAASDATTEYEELKWEGLDGSPLPSLSPLWEIATKILFEKFRFQDFFSDYNGNIQRFKIAVNKIAEGIDTLSTSARIDWWRNNVLPADFHYLSISATMAEIAHSASRVSPLIKNPHVVSEGSSDYGFLRKGYYDLFAASGIMLNDSQMTLNRTLFFPSQHKAMNAMQPDYTSIPIATLSGTHWALALKQAIRSSAGPNPFPRSALIESIVLYLASLED